MSSSSGSDDIEFLGSVSMESVTPRSAEVNSPDQAGDVSFTSPTSMDSTPRRVGRPRSINFVHKKNDPKRYEDRMSGGESDRSRSRDGGGSAQRTPQSGGSTRSGSLWKGELELFETPGRLTRSGANRDATPSRSQQDAWNAVQRMWDSPRAPGRTGAERIRLFRDREQIRREIEKECGQLEELFGSVLDALEDGQGLVKNFFTRKLDGGRQIKRTLKQFVGQLRALLVDGDDLASQQEDRIAAIHQEAMEYVIDLLKTVLREGVVWDLEKGGDKALTSLALPLFEELLRDPQQLRFNTILDLFYRAVDSRSFMVELLDICLEEFRRLKSNLNRQCYKKIIGYSKRSVAENALRTLGRMNYHVRQAGDSLKSTYEDGSRIFRPMPELWPTLRVEYLNMLQGVERVELGESQREKYGNAGGWEDEEEAGQEADEEPAVPEGRQGLFTYYQPTAEQMDVEAEDVLTDESEDDEEEAAVEEEDDQELEENPQIPPDAERLMRGAIAEDLGDDQMDAVADDTARDMLLRMTYICRCTNFCGKPDLRAAMSVLEKLRSLHFYKSVDEKLEKFLDGLETVEDIEDGDQQWTVAEWIGHYKRCYAGLRAIAMRLTDIRTMVRFILRIRSLLEGDLIGRKKAGKDGLTFYETYISVSRLDQLPRRVKLEFSYKHSGRVDDTHHRQKRFGDRYAVYFKDFIDGTNDYEINVCQVCNLLNVAKEMKLVEVDTSISPPPSWLEPYMDRSLNRRPAYGSKEELLRRNNLKRKFDAEWELTSDEENCQEEEEQEETQPVFSYGVCRTCWRAIKKGTVPKLAVVNGLRMPTVPTCMKELNWIEKMLIQLLRPLASICCLRDIGGKKTAIRATKGCQVIVPVDIEATLGRVAETLPSADNLMIEVRTSFGDHRVVNLPKVLKCLHHLKQFHHCYANVEIDEHFHFTAGNNVFFEKTAVTEMDAEKLIERRAGHDNDAHILTQDHFNVKPVQDVHPPQLDAPVPEDDDANIGRYMVRGHKVNPVSVDEPYADIMVFPDQHPTGEFGFSHPRAVRIHMTEYIKARIRNADRRFAKDKNWIIFCYQHLLQKQLTSTLGIQARIGQQTSGADIAARIDTMDMEFLKANMTSIFAKFRGFPPYWHQVKLKLRSHLIAFGPPSFFLTLNPNDQHWLEVIHLYKMRQPEKRIADMVNSRTIRKFIAEDPAIFARYFYRRVRTFFSKFLRAGTGDSKAPLGDITHWFWRHEWQERGTPHVHCLLWTADRPAEDASEEAVVAWINKYITCRLPDKKTEFEMNHLVTSYQMHWKKHNKTCMRKKQYGTHWKTYCRFDMPRPVLGRTVLTENNADIKALLGVRKRPYYLRRTAEETMINDYNPAVTKAWKANTDIQAILPGRAEDNLLGYCTGFSNYAAKGSSRDAFGKPQDDEDDDDLDKLWADLEEEENRADGEKKGLDDSGLVPDMPQVPGMASQLVVGGRKDQNLKAMWKKCLKLMNTRVAGMFEIMDQLMGHKLYEFDCDTVWVNVAKSDKRSRMLIPSKKRLEKSARAFLTNMMDDYYPHRPDALEDCSLFNFVSNFEVVMPERGSGRGKPTQGGGGDGGSDPEDSSDEDPISDDDAIDDDADERLKKKRNNRRRRITADNAQTRNVFKGEYHTDVADSPFFNHPDIDIGDGYNMEFTVGNQTVKKFIRKKKARNIRFNLAAVNYDDEESVEEFYRGICTAFIPWRNEETILKDCEADNFLELFHSYTDPVNGKYSSAAIDDINAFLRRAVALKEDDKLRSDVHRRALEALRKARDPAVMEEEAFDGEGGAIRPTAGGDEPLLVRLEKIDEDGEQVERYPRIVDELQHADMVEKMKKSPKQFCIFAEIIKHIQKQVEQEKAKQPVDEPLRFFISGTAGTGKSFLIKCLADYLSINYVNSERDREDGLSPAVLIAAPTGNAAHGIGGVTIHKLIGAKIFEDMIKEGTLLSNERQQKKRALFAGVKLLIIDEISMCGSMLFYQLNLYLQAIRGDQQLFGGLNVIVLGDLLQLPPVKDLPVFKVPRQRDLEKLLGGRTVGLFRQRFNLWNQFEYRELLENHRQGADRQWGDILYRMRHGANMDEDHSVIAEHLIKSPSGHAYATRNEVLDEFFKVRDQDREVLAIFPTVDEATTFNDCVVEELNLEGTEELICDDVYFQSTHWYLKAVAKELTDPEKPKKERPYQMKGMEIDISGHDRDAANIRYKNKVPKSHRGGTDGAGSLPTIVEGLVDVLHLAPGTRVMLRRNIDTSRGLYNSATGTVEGMEKREEKKSPKGYVVTAVYVRFDSNPSKVFIVRRCSAYYFIKGPEKGSTGKGERRMRTQFPLVISYATTIHRVQGMTCSNVFVSTNYMFAAAHMFVALSRAKSLKGLHLLDYYPSKVMVDLEALQEYNRLRRSINLPVLPMPPGKKRNTHETLEKWSTFGQRASQLSVTGLNLMSQGSSGGPVARLKKSKKGIIEEEQPNPLGKEVKIELASQASSIRRTRLVPLRPLLPYENRRGQGEKSSCFVISAVNIMNQMVDMVEALLKMPRNELSPLLKGLIMLFTQQAAGIEGFRQLLGLGFGLLRL